MILWVCFCYLLGSVPFGLILTRLAGLGDLRRVGSGNIGATNVLRTGRKGLAALTLFLDAAKAAIPLMLLGDRPDLHPFVPFLGFCVVLGHCFPVFLRFRGGKGVATALGVYVGMDPVLGACFALIWLGVAMVFRYSSLAALVTVTVMPFVFLMISGGVGFWEAMPLILMSLLIILRHKDNIHRLKRGEESRIAFTKGSPS